jgi:mRNA-degrading endonuclease toxin of MazEF toxin-antitoxin module
MKLQCTSQSGARGHVFERPLHFSGNQALCKVQAEQTRALAFTCLELNIGRSSINVASSKNTSLSVKNDDLYLFI